jgi:hypothetical protein
MKERMAALISGAVVLLLAVSNVAHVSGQSALVQVVPPPYDVVQGEEFSFQVRVHDLGWISSFQFKVSWVTEYFEYIGYVFTPPSGWQYPYPMLYYPAPDRTGSMFGAFALSPAYVGDLTVMTIALRALKTGSTWIEVDDVSIDPPPPDIQTEDGLVTIVVPPPRHDIAVVDVAPSTTVVGFGMTVYIGVTVENQGDVSETFDVTAYVDGVAVQTTSSALAAGASATVYLAWSTAESGPGNHTISAYAWPVPSESETEDNLFTDGSVLVIVFCDVNGDGKVSMIDLYLICVHYGTKLGDSTYDPACDVNGDGNTNMLDLWLGALNFGLL